MGSIIRWSVGLGILGFVIGAIIGSILYVFGFLPCVLFSGFTTCVNYAGPVILGLGLFLGLVGSVLGAIIGVFNRPRPIVMRT
jgi:hypothetical protein